MELSVSINDLVSEEYELFYKAEDKYGESFVNALQLNTLLSIFVKSVSIDSYIFSLFYSQVKKHHTLALLSTSRRHHIQSMLTLRYVLESGVHAAYALVHPDEDKFVTKNDAGLLNSPNNLNDKSYKWIETNYSHHSKFIKFMKGEINERSAHSNLIQAFNNFNLNGDLIETPFFDIENTHLIKTDFWMIGNIALGLMDLFYGVNVDVKRIVFIEDFRDRLMELQNQNNKIKEELQQHSINNVKSE